MAQYQAAIGDLANRVSTGDLDRKGFYTEVGKLADPLASLKQPGQGGGGGGGGGGTTPPVPVAVDPATLPSIGRDDAGATTYGNLKKGDKYTVPGDLDPDTGKLRIYTKRQ
jgi:hypothetical protein